MTTAGETRAKIPARLREQVPPSPGQDTNPCRISDQTGLGPQKPGANVISNSRPSLLRTDEPRNIQSPHFAINCLLRQALIPWRTTTRRPPFSQPRHSTDPTAKLVLEAFFPRLAAGCYGQLLEPAYLRSCLVAFRPDTAEGHEAQQSLPWLTGQTSEMRSDCALVHYLKMRNVLPQLHHRHHIQGNTALFL
ncbi:hypothetical protein HBI56_068380 [Parastagonospora nodorum]|uniref:Uncharacterized protein n=1 Tax=Phaeosphaeria nodorum (strain SN15 / ATCC MYA-4574 / FGSC 10173) TaxID=321614 RepID=A0A7U2ESB9_PHANO|nr:hypothetical protein HBH56_002880 [Parastagonospora nodorum]QRC90230.1 hypothetical protein JI435_425120 [Parastagonospora nodorum SN15]KAH3937935.1 hypothetical protein HBH54_002880 [Parastagonospora nodorum]KAH3974976.1 hypothetical protein HBH51_085650 [Parastagonospora nodorum]KAH4052933.1 hypothetical protein HBH49_092690 [Parastagonospora nodorum]